MSIRIQSCVTFNIPLDGFATIWYIGNIVQQRPKLSIK